MSTFYKESNLESTENLYDKGIVYRDDLREFAEKYSCLVDFNFAEKFLYGRVNRNYVSIEPNESLTLFESLRQSDSTTGRVKVMSFVGLAFNMLSRHFERSAQIGKIRKTDPYLSTLKPYEGYQNSNVAYSNYFNSVVTAMSRVKQQNNSKITNFDEFISFLKNFSMPVGVIYPITKTGFIRSRYNSIMNNGLSIEISDLVYENDDQKIVDFVNSPNFEYYLNACNSFGFMVDINAPWRIVADLDSVAMQDFASRFGYPNTNAVINIAFKTVHDAYFRSMPQQLLNLYNQISSNYTEVDDCTGKIKIINPKQYTIEEINNSYSESYFIKIYCMLRFLEEESKHSKAKQDLIITDTINLSRIKNIRSALGHFERFMSQPFDYRGSLSYLITEQEKREDI